MSVVDRFGLVNENQYLTLYMPATGTALVFRVVSRVNKGFEVLDYGLLPISSGASLSSYTGTTITAPAAGTLPPYSYTGDIQFPAITGFDNVFDKSDIWHLSIDNRDRLFHVKVFVHPPIIRVDVRIPTGVTQTKFQAGRVVTGIDSATGFSRGFIETVHLPGIVYGYRFGNDTNLNLPVYIRFVYGEYIVEIPKNPELIFNILTKRTPSYWLTLPITYMDPSIQSALRDAYGLSDPWGFKLYREDEKDKAIKEYSNILKNLKV